jgi:hypothetical protein
VPLLLVTVLAVFDVVVEGNADVEDVGDLSVRKKEVYRAVARESEKNKKQYNTSTITSHKAPSMMMTVMIVELAVD